MRVLKYEPRKAPEIVDIPNELEPLQQAVGGYIEVVPVEGNLILIVDEEGLIKGTRFNRRIGPHWIFGTFLVCESDGEEFAGLTDPERAMEVIEKWTARHT